MKKCFMLLIKKKSEVFLIVRQIYEEVLPTELNIIMAHNNWITDTAQSSFWSQQSRNSQM